MSRWLNLLRQRSRARGRRSRARSLLRSWLKLKLRKRPASSARCRPLRIYPCSMAHLLDVVYLEDLANRVTHETDYAGGRGDLKLIVKYDSRESILHSFVVSSSVMVLACKPWERMLTGPFSEGHQTTRGF